jgi:integrase
VSTFVSGLAPQLSAFVQHKRSLGHKYAGEVKELRTFDRFVAAEAPGALVLTEQVVRSFVLALPSPSRSNAVSLLRQLGGFLAADAPTAFVAPPKYLHVRRRRPSIRVLTVAEVKLFLDATDFLSATERSPHRCLVHGMALRTLLFTGLRRDELRTLRDADIDLHDDVIVVRDGKFGKSRYVPVSRELAKRLRAYRSELNDRVPGRLVSDAFFPGPDGRKLTCPDSLYKAFRQTLERAGIKHGGRGEGPRLHDLRHTFAVLRLLAWYRQGEDLNAKLPLLATYLGHVGVTSTQVYLHMTQDLVGEVTRRHEEHFGDIVQATGGAR